MTKNIQKILIALLLLVAGGTEVWGQTDYSGTYYIAMPGMATTYDTEPAEDHYYLVPTEGWCYFVSPNSVQDTDNGQPFLTTYKCGQVRKTKWTIQKHPTEEYYYIIHL